MTPIKATVTGGRLDLVVPSDWPDGIEVEIRPLASEPAEDSLSPEEIARLLAAMDQLEPLEFTDAERAAWDAERQARKEEEKARFAEQAEMLKRMWE